MKYNTSFSRNSQSVIEILENRIAPASVGLGNPIRGAGGFTIGGEAESDRLGFSVSGAGDVNNDGFDDVIVGAYAADPNGTGSGAAYVVFGSAHGITSTLDLSSLNGTNGFKLTGAAQLDAAGTAVSGAGDLNGDGFDDIVIGASGASPNGTSSGAAYVVFGKANGFAPVINLSALDGSNGFSLTGAAADDFAGAAVAAAGDFNGDGVGDLILGAPEADANGEDSGTAYIVFGQTTGFSPTVNLSALNGITGFKIKGEATQDFAGSSVKGAGDVNGDGLDDVIIGAPGSDASGLNSGAGYVVYGRSGLVAADLNLSDLIGPNGFKLKAEAAGDLAGGSVSGAGDLNKDGFADVIIGAAAADSNGEDAGAAYVVFGKPSSLNSTVNLSDLNGTNGFKLRGESEGDQTGSSVSEAGDVDGDGFDDVIIGARMARPFGVSLGSLGTSFILKGKANGFDPVQTLGFEGADQGIIILGDKNGDHLGGSVSAAGDVNGDGFADVIAGADGSDINGNSSGAAYVILGRTGPEPDISFNGKTATFTDADGDRVTVKVSKGELSVGNIIFKQGGIFAELDLRDPQFAGTNVTITAKPNKIGGEVEGNKIVNLGYLNATGNDLGIVNIAGDLGQIDAGDGDAKMPAVKSLTIASLGALGITTQLNNALSLESNLNGTISLLTVKGHVQDATIVATTFGTVKIAGDLDGGKILAAGIVNPTKASKSIALKSLSVTGDVLESNILAGYNAVGQPVNADVQIGKVSVKGAWTASNLVAGVQPNNNYFGDDDDTVIGDGSAKVVSRIASIVIAGAVQGSAAANDHFGFVAEQIGSMKIGKTKVKLTPGTDNVLVPGTEDVRVREIPAAV